MIHPLQIESAPNYPRGFQRSDGPVQRIDIRPPFAVEQRIVGLAHDADFQRDATGELIETTHAGGYVSCGHGRMAPAGTEG